MRAKVDSNAGAGCLHTNNRPILGGTRSPIGDAKKSTVSSKEDLTSLPVDTATDNIVHMERFTEWLAVAAVVENGSIVPVERVRVWFPSGLLSLEWIGRIR